MLAGHLRAIFCIVSLINVLSKRQFDHTQRRTQLYTLFNYIIWCHILLYPQINPCNIHLKHTRTSKPKQTNIFIVSQEKRDADNRRIRRRTTIQTHQRPATLPTSHTREVRPTQASFKYTRDLPNARAKNWQRRGGNALVAERGRAA